MEELINIPSQGKCDPPQAVTVNTNIVDTVAPIFSDDVFDI